VLGATNLHELAYGITSENPHFGAVRNPRNPQHMAGGSSGGSAAAVAAGLALGAVGTDTGGSIRIPAAACGVAGLKPTYGRVSRQGVLPLAWSLDHVGPLAASTADVAVLWAVMADEPSYQEQALARCLVAADDGGDGELPQELQASVRLARALAPSGLAGAGAGERGGEPRLSAELVRRALSGLRFGRPPQEWLGNLDGSVADAWGRVLQRLEELGVTVQTVEPPPMAYIRAAQFLVLQAEAAAVHRTRLYTRPEDLGPDVRLRLQIGEFLMAVDYVQGQRLRRQVAEGFVRLFDRVDVLLLPTLPVPAPPLGTRTVRLGSSSEPIQRVMTRFTVPFNQSGLPALSVPMGADAAGLPLGLQLVGRPGREVDVLRAGMAVEALLRLR
ncbi:MAG TPA: amidase, partial [Limnochordales bacterium]